MHKYKQKFLAVAVAKNPTFSFYPDLLKAGLLFFSFLFSAEKRRRKEPKEKKSSKQAFFFLLSRRKKQRRSGADQKEHNQRSPGTIPSAALHTPALHTVALHTATLYHAKAHGIHGGACWVEIPYRPFCG